MTPLDQALDAFHADPSHTENRHAFYREFLSTILYIPTYDAERGGVAKGEVDDQLLPLIMEADGKNYLMVFDLETRVTEWSEEGAHCIALPAHIVVEMATEELYLALNVGTDHTKQFVPEEIAWLKQVVKQSKETAGEAAAGGEQ